MGYDDSYAGDEAGDSNMQAGAAGYARARGEYDGMPLHDADSYPPREDEGYGYGRDPLPAPI